LTDQQKAEVDIAAEGPPKEGEVSKPQADPAALKIHHTVPIDKSMAKLKAHRKPRKNKKVGTEGIEDEKRKNNAGGRTEPGTPPDAGRGSGRSKLGAIFPVDWFRK
jgi:hypothetical protein